MFTKSAVKELLNRACSTGEFLTQVELSLLKMAEAIDEMSHRIDVMEQYIDEKVGNHAK